MLLYARSHLGVPCLGGGEVNDFATGFQRHALGQAAFARARTAQD
jgi:hypothetical protein